MCPIFNECGDTAVRMVRIKSLTKGMKERQNDVLIACIVYVNDLNKLQQFTVSFQISHHRLKWTFQPSWQ